MRTLVFAVFFLVYSFSYTLSQAQTNAPATNGFSAAADPSAAPVKERTKLRVVARDLEPFSFMKDGRRVGFAMELFEEIARVENFELEVTVKPSARDMVDALAAREADVAIGALSITSERENRIDFSQPFYESGLQIVVNAGPASFTDMIWSTLAQVLNLQFVGALALLIFTMLVISHLVWLFEHKINDQMWPANYVEGMWESFWWTISTLLVGGADNKGPIGVGGRIVAIAWMLLSIVLLSLLTASFTTTLTLNSLKGEINGPNDLPGKRVATIRGSTAVKYLGNGGRNVTVVELDTIPACLKALQAGHVKAVVYDSPILKYEVARAKDSGLTLVGGLFDRSNYGFGLQQDSTIRERINRVMLMLAEQGFTNELNKKWFGEEK
ncbi:hypothetical protein DB346_04695 [Verrucomicrobia bacterium LW23]|nr:hypothetical protein DB346_04695 [Verrucomicrobia bacterium LW23]